MKIPATKAGVTIDAVWCDKAEFDDVGFSVAVEGGDVPEGNLGDMDFKSNLEVWYKETTTEAERGEAIVRLTVELAPERQPSYRVRTAFVGKFSAEPDAQIPLAVFATEMAVTYLVPFIRGRIAELTGASRYDGYLLPPLDIEEMIEGIRAGRRTEEAGRREAADVDTTDEEEPTVRGRK